MKPELQLIFYQCMDDCPPNRKWLAQLFLPVGSRSADGISTLSLPYYGATEREVEARVQRDAAIIQENIRNGKRWDLNLFKKGKKDGV